MYHRFDCHADTGECQEQPYGKYDSLLACRRECTIHPLPPDLRDLTYDYSLATADQQAISEQIRVIKKLTGLEIPPSDVSRILRLFDMHSDDLDALIAEPLLWPYLRKEYGEERFQDALYAVGTAEAVRELRQLFPGYQFDLKRAFLGAMAAGNCELARELDSDELELTSDDMDELYALKSSCVLRYLLDVYGNEHYNEFWFAEAYAEAKEVDGMVALLGLWDTIDYDGVMVTAGTVGGLEYLQQLALQGYYQPLDVAVSYGAPYLYLALEDYAEDPSREEIEALLPFAKDDESVELLRSLLGEE